MYCHHCGEQLPEGSSFCSNCGSKVITEETSHTEYESTNVSEPSTEEEVNLPSTDDASELVTSTDSTIIEADEKEKAHQQPIKAEADQESKQTRSTAKPKKTFTAILPILIPIVSLLIIVAGTVVYYFYEQNINDQVIELQKSAEEFAFEGDFKAAEEKLTKAQELRPDFDVIGQDLEIIKRAKRLAIELENIVVIVENENYDKALDQLSSFKETIEAEKGPLFDSFKETIAEKEAIVTVGKVKQEIVGLSSVSELGDRLHTITTVTSEEAKELEKQIISKIVQISSDKAKTNLEDKQYTDAINAVQEGLQYATNNTDLLSLKDQVESEKAAFEQAEQERIEQAMEAAAQEDLINRTAAVEVLSFESYIDEVGDLNVYGEIQNVATTEISDVTIYFTVYDLNGNYVDDSYTTIYPYYLSPGDYGTFDDWVFYIYEDVTVEIDNITWNLY